MSHRCAAYLVSKNLGSFLRNAEIYVAEGQQLVPEKSEEKGLHDDTEGCGRQRIEELHTRRGGNRPRLAILAGGNSPK